MNLKQLQIIDDDYRLVSECLALIFKEAKTLLIRTDCHYYRFLRFSIAHNVHVWLINLSISCAALPGIILRSTSVWSGNSTLDISINLVIMVTTAGRPQLRSLSYLLQDVIYIISAALINAHVTLWNVFLCSDPHVSAKMTPIRRSHSTSDWH